jgi:DNA/RNA endonuclease G (NUC1)
MLPAVTYIKSPNVGENAPRLESVTVWTTRPGTSGQARMLEARGGGVTGATVAPRLFRLVVVLLVVTGLVGCDYTSWEGPSDAPSQAAEPVLPAGALSAQATSVHVTLGVPVDSDPSDNFIITRSTYVVSYNPKRLGPNWAAWRLTAADFGGAARHRGHFITDESLPAGWYRVQHSDYTASGYDRGHLVR